VTNPFDYEQFRAGLVYGGAGAALLVAAWGAFRTRVPAAGAVLAGAWLLALRTALDRTGPWPGGPPRVPAGLVLGLALLLAAGWLGGRSPRRWASAILATPGAAVVAAHGELIGPTWLRVAVGAAAVVGGLALEDLDERWGEHGLPVALLAVSAVGVFYTTPDTDEALVFLGVVALIAVACFPFGLARLGPGGGYVACALLAWTAASGGVGRETSVIGGIGCLGVLFAVPAARVLGARLNRPRAPQEMAAVLAIHLGTVWVSSRVAGTIPADRAAASVLAATALAGAALACALVLRPARRITRPRRASRAPTRTKP
jgi:hypothetical protein